MVQNGRKLLVENGGGTDVTFDGTFIMVRVELPTKTGRYIHIKFYLTPHDLHYDVILGRKDLRSLGYIMALYDKNEKVVYVHERDNALYDIDRTDDSLVYDMMNSTGFKNKTLRREPQDKLFAIKTKANIQSGLNTLKNMTT